MQYLRGVARITHNVHFSPYSSQRLLRTMSTISPWSIGCYSKDDIVYHYSQMQKAIPLWVHGGAFPFYSHGKQDAKKEGFTPKCTCLSNDYIFEANEHYTFVLPTEYVQKIHHHNAWREELRHIRTTNSEAHVMALKAAWFGDLNSYLHILEHGHDVVKIKDLGSLVQGFNDEDWYRILPHVALEVVWQKFTKVPRFHAYLKNLGTTYKLIVAYTETDGVWGNGTRFSMDETHTTPAEWWNIHQQEPACNILGWALTTVGRELLNQNVSLWPTSCDAGTQTTTTRCNPEPRTALGDLCTTLICLATAAALIPVVVRYTT